MGTGWPRRAASDATRGVKRRMLRRRWTLRLTLFPARLKPAKARSTANT